METIEIKIKKRYFSKLRGILEKLDFVESFQVKKTEIDWASKASEINLAEDWESPEDSRWDSVL